MHPASAALEKQPTGAEPLAELTKSEPFPGLAHFTEEQAAYFCGRDGEIADLTNHIERQVVTVLFGTSGLGKTSLLLAGVFPRLRKAGFFPVNVRMPLADRGVSLTEGLIKQVKAAADGFGYELETAAASSRVKRTPGEVVPLESVRAAMPPAPDGTTLWEFFHRTRIWSSRQRLLTPVIVLDQFEEIVTLGRADKRSTPYLEELADLVRNYQPRSVSQALASGEYVLPYDSDVCRIKVVVAVREDLLAELDGFLGDIAAPGDRRFRLMRMSTAQAAEAITKPNPALVDEAVTQEIIQAVAGERRPQLWRSDRSAAEAEVEPALLSLFCRELNQARLEQRPTVPPRIEVSLVKSNKGKIIENFYERSTEDLSSRACKFIEEKLVSQQGYRTSVPLADFLSGTHLDEGKADLLVNRRLLRFEERFGERHVEIIHDILTGTIRAAREARRRRRWLLRLSIVLLAVVAGGVLAYQRLVAAPRRVDERIAAHAAEVLGQLREEKEWSACRARLGEIQRIGAGRRGDPIRQILSDAAVAEKRCRDDAQARARRLRNDARDLSDHDEALLREVQAAVEEASVDDALRNKLEERVFGPGLRQTLRGIRSPKDAILSGEWAYSIARDGIARWHITDGRRTFREAAADIDYWRLSVPKPKDGPKVLVLARAGKGSEQGDTIKVVELWDEAVQTCHWSVTLPGEVAAVRWLPAGDQLLTVLPGISLWRLGRVAADKTPSGCPVREVNFVRSAAKTANLVNLNLSSDDTKVVAVSGVHDGKVWIWDAQLARSGIPITVKGNVGRPLAATFLPDDRHVAIGFAGGKIVMLEPGQGGGVVEPILLAEARDVKMLDSCRAASGKVSLLATLAPVDAPSPRPGSVLLLEMEGAALASMRPVARSEASVLRARFGSNCSSIVTASDDNTVRVWSLTRDDVPATQRDILASVRERLGLREEAKPRDAASRSAPGSRP